MCLSSQKSKKKIPIKSVSQLLFFHQNHIFIFFIHVCMHIFFKASDMSVVVHHTACNIPHNSNLTSFFVTFRFPRAKKLYSKHKTCVALYHHHTNSTFFLFYDNFFCAVFFSSLSCSQVSHSSLVSFDTWYFFVLLLYPCRLLLMLLRLFLNFWLVGIFFCCSNFLFEKCKWENIKKRKRKVTFL